MAAGRRWIKRARIAALFSLLVLVLGGCSVYGGSPQSVNNPRGDNMQTIWNLFVPIFWMSVVIFVIVQGLLIYAVIRFRRRPGAEAPHAFHGNTKLEIAWTIAPALVLAVIAVPTLTTIADFAKDPGPEALTVRVIGHQWWWEFQYPGQNGAVVADELHIPVNRPIRFELRSADVIHSFWVPQLAGKQDVVPGQNNQISFTAKETGTYRGQCAEFCGAQHANMAFIVVVEEPAAFNDWLQHQTQPAAAAPSDPLVQQGQQLFTSTGCVGCHTIRGTQAAGVVGPDLTHFGQRQVIAGDVLKNTSEELHRWIKNPQAIKPGTIMPNLGLTDEQVNAVVAYLESLK
jgi:cytochrome c oxidase subunit 2